MLHYNSVQEALHGTGQRKESKMNSSKIVVVRDLSAADVTLKSYDLVYDEEDVGSGFPSHYGWSSADGDFIASGVTFEDNFYSLCEYIVDDLLTGTVVLTMDSWVRDASGNTQYLVTEGVILIKFTEVNGKNFVTVQKDMDDNTIQYFPYSCSKENAIKSLWAVLYYVNFTTSHWCYMI